MRACEKRYQVQLQSTLQQHPRHQKTSNLWFNLPRRGKPNIRTDLCRMKKPVTVHQTVLETVLCLRVYLRKSGGEINNENLKQLRKGENKDHIRNN